MNEISWIVILLFLPFCLTMMVSLVEGISDIFPRKPRVVFVERVRYRDRPVKKQLQVSLRVDACPVKTSKKKKKPKLDNPRMPSHIVDEVTRSLAGLGISEKDAKKIINQLCLSKKYFDAESLLKDCINSI